MSKLKHPMKVEMVSIFVTDPVKAFAYYVEKLGFTEVMYSPEHRLAIVESPYSENGPAILLEPTGIEIAKRYKTELYEKGIPVITFSSEDIYKTVDELQNLGVIFKKEPTKTAYGFEAVFDDDNGNYIQLIQVS